MSLLPPYAPSSLYPNPSAPPANEALRKPSTDDQIQAFLTKCDFFILIDKSGSMKYDIEEGASESRWDVVRESLRMIVENAAALDKDGVDVCLFGSNVSWYEGIESAEKVDLLFKEKPRGSTNLTEALKQTFQKHKERKEENPEQKTIVLTITDGKPDDPESVEEAIIEFAKTGLNPENIISEKKGKKTTKFTHEFGIRFFQVGNDKGATEFLKFLDRDLRAEVDIVCTGNIEDLKSDQGIRKTFFETIWN